VIPALNDRGLLPLGRYLTTLDEIEARFAPQGSGRRSKVWREFINALAELRSAVPVCAIWISGSFLTDENSPDDLDVVFFLDSRDCVIARNDERARKIVGVFASNKVKEAFRWAVDSNVVEWVSDTCGEHSSYTVDKYLETRGYWDDFWQRIRHGEKHGPTVRQDALPERGYVEVIIDGFKS